MHLFHHLREFVASYGYWAVAAALLAEHAGIPLPGESVLLFASFLAFSEHRLQLGWIIIVATFAGALGGAIGYAIGCYGGRRLLSHYHQTLHIPTEAVNRGEWLFERYGASTVFFARFIFGMRVVIGPLAGVLRMEPRTFLIVNFLGASAWVSLIAGAGYFFGSRWGDLIHFMSRANLVLLIVAVTVAIYVFWSRRASTSQS